MKLSLTHAALADLRSIRAYTLDTWGAAQKEIYLTRIWSRFEEIRADPSRFRLRADLFPECRIATDGKHGHASIAPVRRTGSHPCRIVLERPVRSNASSDPLVR